MNFKHLARIAALLGGIFVSGAALAQGFTGQIPSGNVYGNSSASAAKPFGTPVGTLLDRAFGSTNSSVLYRSGGSWAESTGPTLNTLTLTNPLTVGNGGTGGSTASGTLLDNITAFSSTGYIRRTGAGAYAFSSAASGAQYLAGTATNVPVEPSIVYQAETTTTFGATTTFDFSTFINTAVTLTANITTQTLSNVTAGKAGTIAFIQDGTGSRTTVWNSVFKFAGGVTPTLSTGANKVDVLSYSCRSATFCVASLLNDVR